MTQANGNGAAFELQPLESRVCLSTQYGGEALMHHASVAHRLQGPFSGAIRQAVQREVGGGRRVDPPMMPAQPAKRMLPRFHVGVIFAIRINVNPPPPPVVSDDAPSPVDPPAAPSTSVGVASGGNSDRGVQSLPPPALPPANQIAPGGSPAPTEATSSDVPAKSDLVVAQPQRAIEALTTTAIDFVAETQLPPVAVSEAQTDAMPSLWSIVALGGETDVPVAGPVLATATTPPAVGAELSKVAADASASLAATPRVFEFAHFGSPFMLLADSVATFIEDSASIPTFAAAATQAKSQAPWLVTAGVIAADLVLLTWLHRKKKRPALMSAR